MRLSRRVPAQFPWTVFAGSAVYVAYAAWTGVDTQGLIWFAVLAGFMKWGREQNLYGVAFVIALVVETYGTSLGGWRYHAVEPWFGLTTTNPPVFVGAIYCTLEVMVRRLGALKIEAQLQRRAAAEQVAEDVLADFRVADVDHLQRE